MKVGDILNIMNRPFLIISEEGYDVFKTLTPSGRIFYISESKIEGTFLFFERNNIYFSDRCVEAHILAVSHSNTFNLTIYSDVYSVPEYEHVREFLKHLHI